MDRVSLIHHGVSSIKFGAYIVYPTNLISPKLDINQASIPGVSGDYLTSNYRYQNVTQTVVFQVEQPPHYTTWYELQYDLKKWLTPYNAEGAVQYEPFYCELLGDSHWEAIVTEPPSWSITNATTAQVTITLTCKPFLKRNDGGQWYPVKDTEVNTEVFSAQPLWHIVGNGDFTLTINDIDYKLNGVDDEIYIDSERFLIYKSKKENRAAKADFLNHNFPELLPGKNNIKLSGNSTRFEFKPNWRRLP